MASNVSVGKTAPVPLGQQPASNSLPVVFAEDQKPIPVEEQNKVQSEVSLSLLGIPRSEVALGIFADVNTYDVNPTEWAQFPLQNVPKETNQTSTEESIVLDGVVHVPKEAGAQLIASDGNTTVLTSKRFFRYQPGRVSASTMGVKMNVTRDEETDTQKGAPSIKKWGIFDKFDGYYFEIVNNGIGNNFRCVRRTQAIIPGEPAGYNEELKWFRNGNDAKFNGSTNFGLAGVDPVIVRDGLVYVAAAIYDPSLVYHPDHVNAIDSSTSPENKLKDFQPNSSFSLRLAQYDSTTSTYTEILKDRKFQFPFDQSSTYPLPDNPIERELQDMFEKYIRADAHCNFYGLISNLARKGNVNKVLNSFAELIDPANNWQETFFGTGTNAENETHDQILSRTGAWDMNPSTANSQAKIWHLLVNTLGGNNITQTHYNNAPGVPISRTISDTNNNVTLKEWFNICVPEPYRFVYEWRPVRAMFSGDKLDGDLTKVRWSDINTSAEFSLGDTEDGLVNQPGKIILTPEGELESQSAYNIDFSKVTMWKTEFSWYGAVGATFLCYVPIGNNEARWVRVHHIRASNQHSVASLGNAFLPITYLCHGGLNSGLDPNNDGIDIGNTLVKYGASYYIDGGDKGTVKLLSKSSDYSRTVPSGTVTFTPVSVNTTDNYIVATRASLGSNNDRTLVGLMGAYIEGDVTIKVKWMEKDETDATNVKLYFTGDIFSYTSGDITLIVPRSQQSLLTLRAKDFISNREGEKVRNRLQIYPIKLGVGVSQGETSDLITIRGYKNPLLITTNSGSTSDDLLSGDLADTLNTKRSVLPIEFTSDQAVNQLGLDTVLNANGKYVFGYFLGSNISGNAGNKTSGQPILGRIYREGGKYYFAKLFSYSDPIYIKGKFLYERNLSVGTAATGLSFTEKTISTTTDGYADQTKWTKLANDGLATFEEITRLSGTQIAQDFALTPVPETGNEIFSYYVTRGGYQFDLQDYFAYNKEYLSFPLTDEVDVISVFGHFDIQQSASPKAFKVNTSLTWEEQ